MKLPMIGFSVAMLFAGMGTIQAEESKQDFKLVNKTGYEIKEVYVSPTKSTDWEEDILGEGVLPDLSARDIHFHRSATSCHWDLKVVYSEDSSSAIWNGIDLCKVEKIIIHYDKDADKTSADFE
jgi:hypothetical protein